MRNIFLSMFFLSLTTSVFAKDITISVKGMVCGFCAQGIEKKFKALPSIDTIQVSLEKKTVVLKTKESQDVSDDVIKQILTDSGYNVEEIKR